MTRLRADRGLPATQRVYRSVTITTSGLVEVGIEHGGLTYELIHAKLLPHRKSHIIATYRLKGQSNATSK